MATLYNTKISATYPGLIKTTDNAALTATLKELTDGSGNASGLYANTAGDFKVTAILEWGSLKDTGTGVTITQWVTAADGIENFNNNTSVPTSAAVKTYVDAVVTASDLDFLGDTGFGAVDLDSQNFSIEGTLNQITTLASNQTIKLSLPNNVEISGVFEGATFVGDLNGTINTDTTAVTQTAGDNSTKVATTAYVDTLDAASDLDFSGDSGTGDVNLNTESLAITGTTNQIVTAANLTGLSLSLPTTVHRDLQGNVTGNVLGDLTGNVTATSILADGVTATTQASSDSSEKVATTAYVKGLDNASDLDITGDSGTGDVNLNTQTLNILGTTNEITTAVVNQTATISLPSSISVDVIGNVTGDLTGNADTATTWETARDLSLTGQATATLSNVDGALAVSGAVTLDNNSVTAKVLTGLPTPAAASVLATDSIVEGIGKLQSQINGLAGGLRFMGSWNVSTNVPPLSSGGGESASGTTTLTSANKLVDSDANFATVSVGDKVVNQVDGQTALVTNVDSSTILSLDADIMLTGESYTIDISPFLTQGHYYVVSVGGARTLNSVTNWSVGDWVIAGANNEWTQLDHTDVEGTGTPEYIPRWSAVGTIGDSIMVQGSNLITVNGTLSTTTNLNSGSNFAVNTDKFTANATTGAVAFEGGLAINTDKFTVNATSGNTLVAGTLDVTDTLIVNKSASAAVEIAQFKVDGTGGTNGNLSYVSILPGSDNFATQLRLHTNNTGNNYQSISNISGGLELATNDGNPMYFKTNSVTRLTISNTGNATFTGTISGVGILSDGSTAVTQSAADASTKVATTAYADAAATAVPIGDYLPLVGGTLTGGLTGTSATFSSNIFMSTNGSVLRNTGGSLQLQSDSSSIILRSNNVTALTIDTSQNSTFAGEVAINSGLLSISGSAGSVPTSGVGLRYVSNRLIVYPGSTDITFQKNDNSGANLTILENGNSTFTGNVGIGDEITLNRVAGSYSSTLSVSSGNLITDVVGASAAFIVKTGGANALTIDSSGQVLIDIAGTSGADLAAGGLAYRNNSGSYLQLSSGVHTDSAFMYFYRKDAAGTGVESTGNISNNGLGLVLNGAGQSNQLVLDSSGNSTFAGNVTLSGLQKKIIFNSEFRYIQDARSGADYFTIAQNSYALGIQLGFDDTIGGGFGATMTIKPSGATNNAGNVGIGNINPSDYSADANNLVVGSLTGNNGITILSSSASGYGSLYFADASTGNKVYSGYIRYQQNQSNMTFGTNEVERMRIDSSGNVGIGVTTPYTGGTAGRRVLDVGGTSQALLAFSVGGAAQSYFFQDGTDFTMTNLATAGGSIVFQNNGAERMRITSGGEVLIRRASSTDTTFSLQVGDGADDAYRPIRCQVASTGTRTQIGFYNTPTAEVGTISTSGTSTLYNTTSDYRLKEDLQDFAGLDMVSKIPVYDFKWKTDESRSYGVMAHELKEVLPDAVTGDKDAEEMQGVDYSKIVPLLVKSIQELKAEVDLLKSNKCNCKN